MKKTCQDLMWTVARREALRNACVTTGVMALYLIVTVPLHAQLQLGEPLKTPNINLRPPIAEGGANLTPDGLTMYFHSSKRPDSSYPSGEYYLYSTSRETTLSDWQTPVPLPVEVNQGGDSGPSISSDGLSLYFSRGDEFGPGLGADIYVATRDSLDSLWNTPEPVANINEFQVADLYPDISADGLELYFTSARSGSVGASDIWVSRRDHVEAAWGEPENVESLNTRNGEFAPDLSSDGLTMLLSLAPGPGGRSSEYDTWIAQRDTLESPWETPELLMPSAIFAHLAPDASTIYYAHSPLDTTDLRIAVNTMDIWQVPIVSEAVVGDFNFNGFLDANDIDLLSIAVRERDNDLTHDLNADGLVDDADHTFWVRDLRQTYFGDADLNGVFDTQDLVRVLATGEYEDSIPMNSTWATGDWDGDAEFTSGDLVLALQDGGYEVGPRTAVAAVPEPTAAFLTAFGLLGCLFRRNSKNLRNLRARNA